MTDKEYIPIEDIAVTKQAKNALRDYVTQHENVSNPSEAILQLIDENDNLKFGVGE